MKKIITLAILFCSFASFAQIKVLETVPVEKLGKVNNNYIQKLEMNILFIILVF